MNSVVFCETHQIDKIYLHGSQKYQCRKCNAEKSAEYRKNNPDKKRLSIRKSAAKRREFVKLDKIYNPEKYQNSIKPSEFCEKHNKKKVMSTDNSFVCRECKSEYAREFREKNTNYIEHKLKSKLKKFGLTKDQYFKLIDNTDNRCYICFKRESRIYAGKTSDLSIDHCHEAEKNGLMKVRGLLCHACNTSLGGFKDSIELLQSAITYLKKHETINDEPS